MIDRIIFNGVPDCESSYGKEKLDKVLCRPYLQIFLQNNIAFSSLDNNGNPLASLTEAEQSISFHIGVKVNNDVLIRFRHFHNDEKRDSICRIFFNTSFVMDNYLRISKVFALPE